MPPTAMVECRKVNRMSKNLEHKATAALAAAPCSASDEVIRMVFAFGDKERQDAVKKLAERVRRLEWFVKECRDDFDCDHDAHQYKTTCRACAAAALMPNAAGQAVANPSARPHDQ